MGSGRQYMESFVNCENGFRSRVVGDPVHVRKLLTREPGDPASGLGDGPRSAL